jgi:hypothetical protein
MTSAASRRVASIAALGAVGALVACPPPPPTPDCGFWGTQGALPFIEIGMRLADGGFGELTQDGLPVDLTFPTQGGHVLFVGARIHDMPKCNDVLSATVSNPQTGAQYATEEREVSFKVADGTGGIPDLSDTAYVANVPMCPDYGARDVLNQDWVLQVVVADDAGDAPTKLRHVTPVCRQSDPAALAQCQCECAANYFLGKCAPGRDAGSSDGGTDGGDGG